MPPNQDTAGKTAILSRFVDRFLHDRAFRALAQSDAHAALHSIGVKVPSGVRIRFADSAASAIGMMLDQPPAAAAAGMLDDELLMQVSGGVTDVPATSDELQRFLGLLDLNR